MQDVLIIAAVLLLALVFAGTPTLAKRIARRRANQAPPAHPEARRREALSRAALDEIDWRGPR